MRRYLAAVAAAALLAGCGQPAQAPAPGETTPAAVTRVGAVMVVSHPSLEAVYEGFLEQLAKGGLIEGQNLEVDLQNPQGDQATMTSIANTFASSDYDYFLAIATPPAQALAQAISDRPVVFASVTDPVAAGLVTSMEAPGGNVTGTSDQLPTGEQLALIKEIDPSVETVGIVYASSEVNAQVQAEKAMEAAPGLGLEVKTATVVNSSEVQQAAQSLDVDAYFVLVDNTVVSALEAIVQVAEQKGSLLVASDGDSVARGAAAALATDYKAQGAQTARILLDIIDGADPATTPVQTQESLQLVVNPDAAERMGTTLPATVVAEAAVTY